MELNKIFGTILMFVGIVIVMFSLLEQSGTIKILDGNTWCEWYKPRFNVSDMANGRIAYCFNEGWSEYCKISYPNDCN